MKQCANCGAELDGLIRFCPSCGEPVSVEMNQTYTGADEYERQTRYVPAPDMSMDAGGVGTDTAGTQDAAGGFAARAAVGKSVESHIVKAIISTLCCCMPIGIVAVIYAAKVKPLLSYGDTNAALEASKKANMWANLAIGMAVLLQILWISLSRFLVNSALFEMLETMTVVN